MDTNATGADGLRDPWIRAEEGRGGDDDEDAGPGGCFPLKWCEICPPPARMCCPSTMIEIQDWTHLTLVLGMMGVFILAGMEILHFIIIGYDNMEVVDAVNLALLLTLLLPNGSYFWKTIKSFDMAVMAREKAVAREKENLMEAYENTIKGMDQMLSKSTGTGATLAEQGFEAKRRDFIRFLDHTEEQQKGCVTMMNDEAEGLLEQFRAFIKNWLTIFGECSIDPINRPKFVLSDEELQSCTSVAELCQKAKERLQQTEVVFISEAAKQDRDMVEGFRKAKAKYETKDDGPRGVTVEMARMGGGADGVIDIYRPNPHDGMAMAGGDMGTGYVAPKKVKVKTSTGFCTWFVFVPCGCACTSGSEFDGWPRTAHCFCLKTVIFSNNHIWLILGFFTAIAIAVLQVLMMTGVLKGAEVDADKYQAMASKKLPFSVITLVCVFCVEITIVVLLAFFEKLDTIQRLQAQVHHLTELKEQLLNRREQMDTYWAEIMATTDIWAYRVTPRLELYKEVHAAVEDIAHDGDPMLLHCMLKNVNQRVENLEAKLPALSDWKAGGPITEDQKKGFKTRLESVYQGSDVSLPKLLTGVSEICSSGNPVPPAITYSPGGGGGSPSPHSYSPGQMQMGGGTSPRPASFSPRSRMSGLFR